ncbi:hypothetical protein ACP4OV_029387 [Aristida adscensionis]
MEKETTCTVQTSPLHSHSHSLGLELSINTPHSWPPYRPRPRLIFLSCTLLLRSAMKKPRARPRRIPAFGEWNYGYGGGGGDWPVTQYFDAALQLQAGLVMAPKPVKKVVKWSDSYTLEVEDGEKHHQQQQHKKEQGVVKKQSRVADCSRKVVKAVDEDLYEIPPDMLCNKPRHKKKVTTAKKSLWMGCLGLSCIA